jgi:hypothetical protein
MRSSITAAALAMLLLGCGSRGPSPTATGSAEAGRPGSGILGRVHLGPQCPLESAAHPCPDRPAAGSVVTISGPVPARSTTGLRVVARTTSDAAGAFRVALPPGRYVVTADAGMSCPEASRRVVSGAYAEVDLRCDTGIR